MGQLALVVVEVSSLFRSSLSPALPPLTVFFLSFLPRHLSWVLFPATSPPTTSSIVISMLRNLTSIIISSSKYSAGFVSFLVQRWHFMFACVFSSQYIVSPCHPSIRLVPVVLVLDWCLSSRDEVSAFCPSVRSVPFVVSARLVPAVPVQGWCLSSRCYVNAFCPSVRLVHFIGLQGRHLSSQYEVSACCPAVRSVPVILELGRCLSSPL